MEEKQKQALGALKEFRDFIKDKAYKMASLSWKEYESFDSEQLTLVQELHENYDEEDNGLSIRRIVKDAFGTYPFPRISWCVFEECDLEMSDVEKADYIYTNQLVNDNEDFDVDEVGRDSWVKRCWNVAEQLLKNVVKCIDEYIRIQEFLDKEHGIF